MGYCWKGARKRVPFDFLGRFRFGIMLRTHSKAIVHPGDVHHYLFRNLVTCSALTLLTKPY